MLGDVGVRVPDTWDALRDAATALTRRDGANVRLAEVLSTKYESLFADKSPMQLRYVVTVFLAIIGTGSVTAQQGSFLPADPFRRIKQPKTTPETAAVPLGTIENAVLFEKEPRSHLVDVIMDRWL